MSSADRNARVARGDRLRIPAAVYNDLLDAAHAHLAQKRGRGGPPGSKPDIWPAGLVVLVRNDTGTDLERGHVVAPTADVLDAADQPLAAQRRPVFAGDAPGSTADPVLILLEPIAEDGIGLAVAGGVAVCTVNVSSGSHLWARPTAGNTDRLESADSGPARIITREGGSSGDKVAVVALNNGGIAGGLPESSLVKIGRVTAKVSVTGGYTYTVRRQAKNASTAAIDDYSPTEDTTTVVSQDELFVGDRVEYWLIPGGTYHAAHRVGQDRSRRGTMTNSTDVVDSVTGVTVTGLTSAVTGWTPANGDVVVYWNQGTTVYCAPCQRASGTAEGIVSLGAQTLGTGTKSVENLTATGGTVEAASLVQSLGNMIFATHLVGGSSIYTGTASDKRITTDGFIGCRTFVGCVDGSNTIAGTGNPTLSSGGSAAFLRGRRVESWLHDGTGVFSVAFMAAKVSGVQHAAVPGSLPLAAPAFAIGDGTSSYTAGVSGTILYGATAAGGIVTALGSGLSSGNITTALGFTPYDAANPSNYISGIDSGMVTTALGFTPYDSANPANYISGIDSSAVTTALGFTPADAADTYTKAEVDSAIAAAVSAAIAGLSTATAVTSVDFGGSSVTTDTFYQP